MRLSVEDMTGPDPDKAGLCVRAVITLDGVKQERCIVADEEEGFIMQHSLNEAGQVYADERGDVATEILYGKVRIIDPEALPLAEVYLK